MTLLRSVARGYLTRRRRDAASVALQKVARCRIDRRRAVRLGALTRVAKLVQSWWRGARARRYERRTSPHPSQGAPSRYLLLRRRLRVVWDEAQ